MRGRVVLLLVALAAGLAACGGAVEGDRSASGAPAGSVAPVAPALGILAEALPRPEPVADADGAARGKQGCEAGETRPMRTGRKAYAAVAKRALVAYARPGGKRVERFERLNANGYPTVFGILDAVLGPDCRPAWYRVQLPIRPNGSTGFVRASDVRLARVSTRIEIDLSERKLVLFDRGSQKLSTTVAVGSDISPTPPGSYYVNQRLVAPDPWGPYGPAALGISGFSPTLEHWVQGGPLAIHGTNDPSSIGQPVSHGCVRVPNDVLLMLFERVPAGTPVEIRA